MKKVVQLNNSLVFFPKKRRKREKEKEEASSTEVITFIVVVRSPSKPLALFMYMSPDTFISLLSTFGSS